jgi:type II secretory ATPase GspE/PulE/Tfp pilus assembly ATPase PilB-like protein
MRGEHAADDIEGMEFISSSEQQRNIEAMREIQAELLQKSKTTPAVQVVASTIKAAVQRSASDIIEPQSAETAIRLRATAFFETSKGFRERCRIPSPLA